MICNGTLTDHKKVCNSCTVYIVLLVIFFHNKYKHKQCLYLFSFVLKKKTLT